MIRVVPCRLRKSPDGDRAELTLRAPNADQAVLLYLPLEQARVLAVELHGLGTDQCGHHHLVLAMAHAFEAQVTGVALKAIDAGSIMALLRLDGWHGTREIVADVPAARAMAAHVSLPIYLAATTMLRANTPASEEASTDASRPSRIPSAFQPVIDGLDLSPREH
jgi:hypothetical protein